MQAKTTKTKPNPHVLPQNGEAPQNVYDQVLANFRPFQNWQIVSEANGNDEDSRIVIAILAALRGAAIDKDKPEPENVAELRHRIVSYLTHVSPVMLKSVERSFPK